VKCVFSSLVCAKKIIDHKNPEGQILTINLKWNFSNKCTKEVENYVANLRVMNFNFSEQDESDLKENCR
jgi:hypothetical protein